MKEKYTIRIADISLTILSDEPEEFVQDTVAQLNTRVTDMALISKRSSKLDIALLCALDYLSEKQKCEKKIKNLEAQISLLEAAVSRHRAEAEELALKAAQEHDAAQKIHKDPALEEKQDAPQAAPEIPDSDEPKPQKPAAIEQIALEIEPTEEETSVAIHDGKIRQIEELLRRRSEEQKSEDSDSPSHSDKETAAPSTRDEKLREIEALLRRNGSAQSLSEALHDALAN